LHQVGTSSLLKKNKIKQVLMGRACRSQVRLKIYREISLGKLKGKGHFENLELEWK